MARVLFFLAMLFAAASAFVAPVNHGAMSTFAPRTEAPKMMFGESADMALTEVSNFASSTMIATSSSDFGGALFPVFGVAGLCALILYLAPPLKDD
mmetsp:Transcript_28720/g.34990  ORF Transcript_28720/g.34990 Transcript_28720/m.34990 type:complete len:96 (+) Transcript_28720:111-398(+)